MEQIHRAEVPPKDRDEEPPAPLPAGGAGQAQAQAIDDLLDQIDEVLEDSAEAFVQGFVQKGGQ